MIRAIATDGGAHIAVLGVMSMKVVRFLPLQLHGQKPVMPP
jgi:hypothetical protein